MNRHELQILSNMRLRDARVLLANQQYSGAYYLLGYAVECAFKACIARRTRRFDFPDRRMANDSYVHDLERLLRVSGLLEVYEEERETNPQLEINWTIVKQWSEEARYVADITEAQAEAFYLAVTARPGGVLTWLKKWW
jgi:HEPN domain-containing protein